MQRHLDIAGTSFSALVEEVRHNLSLPYMTIARYPIGRVASQVGYSHHATFTRWFVSRFGLTAQGVEGEES